MTAHGAFHWNELMTRDVKKAKDFYARTLGWTYEDMPMGEMYGTYTVARSGGQMVGGIFDINGPMFADQKEGWFSYVAVDDLDRRLQKAKEAGGKVLMEPFDVKGVGRMAILSIPGGAAQGWIVPDPAGM